MWVCVDSAAWLRDAHPAEQVNGVFARHLVIDRIVDAVGLNDLVAHGVVGVHSRERVLEDHGHALSAQAADVLRSLVQQLIPVEIDLAAQLRTGPRPLRSRPGMQAHDRQAGDALARSRLAHNAKGSAAIEGEAQPVDRLHQPVVGREVHMKINNLQKWLFVALPRMPDDQVTQRGRRHSSRTRGSMTPYRRSTNKFAMITKKPATIVT